MTELLDHVATLPDQLNCTQCNAYRGEKPQNLAKHIALVHSMLDFYLQNNALVQAKRKEVMAKPKKIVIGDTCPGTQNEYNLFYMNPVFFLKDVNKDITLLYLLISSLLGKNFETR